MEAKKFNRTVVIKIKGVFGEPGADVQVDCFEDGKQKEKKPALRLVGDGLISDPNSHFELVGEQFDKDVALVKSLRPSWKPSKEELDALQWAIGKAASSLKSYEYGWIHDSLLSLFAELKKLVKYRIQV